MLSDKNKQAALEAYAREFNLPMATVIVLHEHNETTLRRWLHAFELGTQATYERVAECYVVADKPVFEKWLNSALAKGEQET